MNPASSSAFRSRWVVLLGRSTATAKSDSLAVGWLSTTALKRASALTTEEPPAPASGGLAPFWRTGGSSITDISPPLHTRHRRQVASVDIISYTVRVSNRTPP